MGTKYPTQSTSGYNASPPSDDGTAVSSNEVTWSFIKTKLADILKTFGEDINSAILTHTDESVLDKAVTYTTTAADHKRTINVTAAATQSLGDASTMAVGYIVTIKNSHSAAITVDLATGADTLDGTAAGSLSLAPDAAATFVTTTGADGYLIVSVQIGDDLTLLGDLMVSGDLDVTGATQTSASTTSRAGLNITEGDAPSSPVDGDVWVTAAGEFNAQLDGSTVDLKSGRWTYLAEVNPTSGSTAASFTIPSGVKAFEMIIDQIGGSTGDEFYIRLNGETTGYRSNATRTGDTLLFGGVSTIAFEILRVSSADDVSGIISFRLLSGDTWVCSGQVADDDATGQMYLSGAKTTSAELSTVTLELEGGNWDNANAAVIVAYET